MLRKGFVVLFFFGMEADVFEQKNFAVSQRLALGFRDRTDTIRSKAHGFADQRFKFFRHRKKRKLGLGTALGTPEMRSEDQTGAFFNRETQRWNSFADARVIGDDGVLERHVEVYTNENALPAEFEIVNGKFIHGFVTHDSSIVIRNIKGQGKPCPYRMRTKTLQP